MNDEVDRSCGKEYLVVVAGSRTFNNFKLMKKKLDSILSAKIAEGYRIIIISGAASGADTLGERYAAIRGYGLRRFPVTSEEWEIYGNGAGYRRNAQMAEIANAVVCFWDSKSHGTKQMIDISKEKRLPVRVIHY